MNLDNAYHVLRMTPGASMEQIERAYHLKVKEVNEAYQLLKGRSSSSEAHTEQPRLSKYDLKDGQSLPHDPMAY